MTAEVTKGIRNIYDLVAEGKAHPSVLEFLRLTPEDIIQIKKKQCSKCQYFEGSTKALSLRNCEYVLYTGQMRKCSPINCKKFTPRIKRNRHAFWKDNGKEVKNGKSTSQDIQEE